MRDTAQIGPANLGPTVPSSSVRCKASQAPAQSAGVARRSAGRCRREQQGLTDVRPAFQRPTITPELAWSQATAYSDVQACAVRLPRAEESEAA